MTKSDSEILDIIDRFEKAGNFDGWNPGLEQALLDRIKQAKKDEDIKQTKLGDFFEGRKPNRGELSRMFGSGKKSTTQKVEPTFLNIKGIGSAVRRAIRGPDEQDLEDIPAKDHKEAKFLKLPKWVDRTGSVHSTRTGRFV